MEKQTIVANELEALGERRNDFLVNLARHAERVKGSIGHQGAFKGSGTALLKEAVPVGGLGGEDVGNATDGLPSRVCTAGSSQHDHVQGNLTERNFQCTQFGMLE
jgi:hypothetical protein